MENHDIHALETIEILDNYNSYVFNKIFNIGLKNNVLDFGCGFGTFIEYINKNYKLEIYGYEIHPEALKKLKSKQIKTIDSLQDHSGSFDFIVSLNVLEHIKDDQSVINEFKTLLKENGELVLYLPHSMKIWSNLDSLVGHHRRYSREELFSKLESAGFEILSWEYVDFIGWLVLFANRYLRLNFNYDERVLIRYDKYIFRFFKHLDIFFKSFLGKNILVVSRKKV